MQYRREQHRCCDGWLPYSCRRPECDLVKFSVIIQFALPLSIRSQYGDKCYNLPAQALPSIPAVKLYYAQSLCRCVCSTASCIPGALVWSQPFHLLGVIPLG